MSQTDWIKIDSGEFNRLQIRKIGGVDTKVALSPHDVPVAFRVQSDKERCVLIIEFQYIDDEQTTEYAQVDGVRVRLGEHSKRLFEIVLSHEFISRHAGLRLAISPPDENIASVAVGAFEREQQHTQWATRMRDSYDTVRKVLQEKFITPGTMPCS